MSTEPAPNHHSVHVEEVAPAPVGAAGGWKGLDIRFLIEGSTCAAKSICFWRTVFPPGAAHERHHHPNAEEVFFVLRGRGASGAGDGEHEVLPGMAVHVPAGVVHWFRNPGPEEVELVGTYTPVASLEEAGYVYVGEITEKYRQVSDA